MEESPNAQTDGVAPTRQSVLESARRLLGDGQPRTAKQVAADLTRQGLAGIDKALVNSVLSREGHGEFTYDRASYTYALGGEPADGAASDAAPTAAPSTVPGIPRQAVLTGVRAILRDGQPRMAREIAAELAKRGLTGVDKSLVNSVLSREGKDEFSYDKSTYSYTLLNRG